MTATEPQAEGPHETIEMPPTYDSFVYDTSFAEQLAFTLREESGYAVSERNKNKGGKPWDYALISHNEVRLNSSFEYLVNSRSDNEQLELEFDKQK